MLDTLDASAVRRWATTAARDLQARRAEIDALNVYPVPDADTGTNLVATARAAAHAITLDGAGATDGGFDGTDGGADSGALLRAMARAAVLDARGNSGVILSQVLRGFAEAADGQRECDAATFRAGIARAADQAYAAVARPEEGTVLSVARAAARSVAAQPSTASLGELTTVAVVAARVALERTTHQLAPLAAAGVVDAGGQGLVVVLAALDAVVHESVATPEPAGLPAAPGRAGDSVEGDGYEVQYLLDAAPAGVDALRARLDALGGSVAVVGTGEGVWNVHVHVPVERIGTAVEAALESGRPHRIRVSRFADAAPAEGAGGAVPAEGAGSPATKPESAVVAVVAGAELARVFRDAGVLVVPGGADAPPTVDVLYAVLRAAGSRHLVVLPNAEAVTEPAERAAARARADGIDAAVVPTRSPVQGLAAVAVHDPARRFGDDVIAMAETAAATRWAEVTVATREALTMAGRCQPGDALGLIGGEVVVIGADVLGVGRSVIERLLGVGGELVTVLVGQGTVVDELVQALAATAPHVDVTVLPGDPAGAPLLIGVE